jgi:hypothetical protein
MWEIFAKESGHKPLRPITALTAGELLQTEGEIATAIATFVQMKNELPDEVRYQVVVTRDGVIVAVEGHTSRKLVWTN